MFGLPVAAVFVGFIEMMMSGGRELSERSGPPSAEFFARTSAHVNVSVLYQSFDTANQPWPTCGARTPRRYLPGRVARGSVALRKMACPLARGAFHGDCGSRPSTRAQGRGSPVAAPSNLEENGRQENTGPCQARRPLVFLRNHRLGCGARCFYLSLCRARDCRRSRRSSPKAPTLKWTDPCPRQRASPDRRSWALARCGTRGRKLSREAALQALAKKWSKSRAKR
jgi:hypothetical protein